ncbi:hypothetical protein BT69DRAFT_1277096 [Atractiella rhizophila]|nr:hypothetical protein BT69DRAFT_1277096 [Atractiella rhizophila]
MTVRNLADGTGLDVDVFVLTIPYNPPTTSSGKKKNNAIGAAIGGAVAGVLLVVITFFLYRYRRHFRRLPFSKPQALLHSRTSDTGNTPSPFSPPPLSATTKENTSSPSSDRPISGPYGDYEHGGEEVKEIMNAHQLRSITPTAEAFQSGVARGWHPSSHPTMAQTDLQNHPQALEYGGSPWPSKFPEIQGTGDGGRGG